MRPSRHKSVKLPIVAALRHRRSAKDRRHNIGHKKQRTLQEKDIWSNSLHSAAEASHRPTGRHLIPRGAPNSLILLIFYGLGEQPPCTSCTKRRNNPTMGFGSAIWRSWPCCQRRRMFLPTLRQRSGSLRQNIPLTGAQDTAYALAVTMNCGATARKDPSARLDCPNSTAASIRAGWSRMLSRA